MACFFGTYIDDIRTGGPTEAACKATSRRVASRINYLGQQDAARKRGQPDQQPRAWAGAKNWLNAALCLAKVYLFSVLKRSC